jgi:hypothetical protein
MQNLINKYPLDLTGKSPNNFVTGEPHDLRISQIDSNRVFVPVHGGFYTHNIKLYDVEGTVLVPNVDYVATYLYEEATHRSGLEVCGAIIVTNPNVSYQVYFDYQVVGGDYALSSKVMTEIIEALNADQRPVEWGKITGKPDAYPAAGHRHALWELYGFEYVITELERIAQAIKAGDQAMFDELRDYILRILQEAKDYTDALDQRFQDHAADKTNPHDVTKVQVGLGNVDNYRTATALESEDNTRTDLFMSPNGTYRSIKKFAITPLDNHIDNELNPHKVTKAQVGLSLVANYSPATHTEAFEASRFDRYMSPVVTGHAIREMAVKPLNTHTGDRSNPHNVTKSQVGLGLVANHSIATDTESTAGTSRTRYMSPKGTDLLITKRLGPYATKTDLANAVNNSALATSYVQSSSMNLDPGGKYMVSVYGVTTDRGTGGQTLGAIGLKNSSGSVLTSTPSVWINWHDGSAPQSAVFFVTVPSDGKVVGYCDGSVKFMSALKVG